MERFKPAAGRMATIYYKLGSLKRLASPKNDIESEDKRVASTAQEVQGDEKPNGQRMPSNINFGGSLFLWRDLSLDIKEGDGGKRLLDQVTG